MGRGAADVALQEPIFAECCLSMIRFYLKLIFPFALSLFALSLIAYKLGERLPLTLNPALRGFVEGCEGKSLPCWYGIVPGITTIDEALSVMEEMGYPSDSAERWDGETHIIFHDVGEMNMWVDLYNYYFPHRDTNVVAEIYLRDLGDLQMIDMLAFFGAPSHITLSRHSDYLLIHPSISVNLDGNYDGRLSQTFYEIHLATGFPLSAGLEWKGRLKRDAYCEMESSGIGCD
jgi:hypothetical protein